MPQQNGRSRSNRFNSTNKHEFQTSTTPNALLQIETGSVLTVTPPTCSLLAMDSFLVLPSFKPLRRQPVSGMSPSSFGVRRRRLVHSPSF
ncbi:hypothetical protein TNCV_1365521 [Trichonephila clavipes]|nr:hypothetical protein TNCV_1365521 [Trichonephila clavipes]